MKKNYTHVAIVLDRSGSMGTIKNDIIGGFNQLIEDQKKETGEMTVTLVSFAEANDYTVIYNRVPIAEVKTLTSNDYRTAGGTALNDSFVRLINETGNDLRSLSEDNRPEKVLLVSITDGEENSSREFAGKEGNQKLKELIKHQEDKYNWKFLYIGANQDSFEEGQLRGIGQTMNFMADEKGTQVMYASMSKSLRAYRQEDAVDFKIDTETTD